MRQDLEEQARSDPALADLLEFRPFFLYGDYRLFREGRAPELAEKLFRKLSRTIRLFGGFALLMVIIEIPKMIDAIQRGDIVQVTLSTIILTLFLIGAPYLIFSLRERRRAIQQIVDRLDRPSA